MKRPSPRGRPRCRPVALVSPRKSQRSPRSSPAMTRVTSRAPSLPPTAGGPFLPDRRSGMRRLEGKRAVVTGGGSGIGRASAIRFAREGASVLVVGRAGNTDETAAAIRNEGGIASALITDASIEENVAEMVRRCVSEFGGLEIFFANIGVTGTNTPLLEQTVEEWSEVYRINTISCFLAIKYAGRHMTAKGYGSIILTSSAASLRANAGAISYSASKAAVNNLAQTAANAFAGTGVRVNAVLPGLVETQLTRKVFEDARARGIEAKLGHVTPMKRPGRSEEIAAAAAFLASDDSSYVDGQLLSVDGGVSSTHPYGRIAL